MHRLGIVQLACEHAAHLTLHKLGRGIRSLDIISRVAPALGVVLLLEGVIREIRLVQYPNADVAGGWEDMLLLFMVSLFVASVAMAFHCILSSMVNRYRLEMEAAALDLLKQLNSQSTKI